MSKPELSFATGDLLDIKGLLYQPHFLSATEQGRILAEIDARPWQYGLKRRVQHYGYQYDYKSRRIDRSMHLGPLPSFAVEVAELLIAKSLITQMPDQAIINEYLPGQGISAHVDCEPCFGETISTVSLGWAYEMEFSHTELPDMTKSILLEVGSALVMSDEARHIWRHGIRGRKQDRGVPRQRRVSFTFRNVLLDTAAG